MHLMLDEIIRALDQANNALTRAEDDTDEELAALKERYDALCREHESLRARLDPDRVGNHVPAGGASVSS